MGADFSTPLTANIKLKLGGNEDVVMIREVSRRSVQNNDASARSQQQRDQGQTGQQGATGGGPQQRNIGLGEQGCSTGGGRSLGHQRCNAETGNRQNVRFFKAGNLHKPAGQAARSRCNNMANQERRPKESLGSRRRAPGVRDGQTGRGHVIETVTLDSDSDNETLEEIEAKLAWMIEQRLKRKRSHNSLE